MTDPREQLEISNLTAEISDLAALLARATDGDLTAEEQARVERAVADDPQAATAKRQYEQLGALLAAWRPLPAEVDWSSFRRTIIESIEAQSEAIDEVSELSLDEAVRNWAGSMPGVDWSGFHARVSAAVRDEAARSTAAQQFRLPAAVRWLAPLAVAAVIAIAAFRLGGPVPGTEQGDDSRPSIVLVSLDIPESSGRVMFSFDESAPAESKTAATGTAYIVSEPVRTADASDEALF